MFGKEFLCFSGERHCSESPGLLMRGHSKIKLIHTIDIMSSFSRMSGCLSTHPSPLPFNCEPVLFVPPHNRDRNCLSGSVGNLHHVI